MLVLARNLGEALIIGEEVEVKILEVRGYKVRLGIDAPKEVKIHRKEVYLSNLRKLEEPSSRKQA